MEWSLLLEILKWLIPVGGFGSVVGWLFNRTERELKHIREEHTAYKAMNADLSETIKEDIYEKKELRKTVAKLERAILRVYSCRHFPHCPVSVELQQQQTNSSKPKQANKRQPRNKGKPRSNTDNGSGVEGTDENTIDESTEAPGGCDVRR